MVKLVSSPITVFSARAVALSTWAAFECPAVGEQDELLDTHHLNVSVTVPILYQLVGVVLYNLHRIE